MDLAIAFESKIELEMKIGHFIIKTITSSEELLQAFALRYQVFQVETVGTASDEGLDTDDYDLLADHLAIIDQRTGQMVATCRLNCSLFTNRFYSEQEFNCHSLLERPETKLEIGRVCVHRDFRKGVIILLLWRAIVGYMQKSRATLLFGCGSVMTEDADEVFILYRYLEEKGKLRSEHPIFPTDHYRFLDFEKKLIQKRGQSLSFLEQLKAEKLLPALCKSYFDIGCYVPGPPAFDRDFKCIDFLTILESNELSEKIRKKMMGGL